MEVKDMKPGTRYGTCDGRMLELVEPVHARWVQTESGEFVELEADALPNKRTDPWGKCHTRSANLGVRVLRYAKDDIDRHGEPLEGAEPEELVIMPRDVAGSWRDYLVLHGETVRQHAVDVEGRRAEELYRGHVRAIVAERYGVPLDRVSVDVRTYRRDTPEWDIEVTLQPEEVALLVAEAERADA